MRSAVDIALNVIGIVVYAAALFAIGDDVWRAADIRGRTELLRTHEFGYGYISAAIWAWFLSEPIVMLLNARRKAIHDYIAGTVVVTTARPGVELMRLPR